MSSESVGTQDWLSDLRLQNDEDESIFEPRWQDGLVKNKKGAVTVCLANALFALENAPEWQGVLQFDESAFSVTAKVQPPWVSRPVPFRWRDEDDIRAAEWLQRQGIMVSKETAGQAIQAVARENPFHPIRDFLNSLEWDGIRRIDSWLTLFLSVDSTDYTRAVGAKWLIGAVARVFKPGCKNDTCLILEGPQGLLKSTALRTLAGDEFFTDDFTELGSKDSVMQTRGVWIIELAELDAMYGREISKIKAFMSRQVDRVRLPYGRRVTEAPRECIFAGTVNHDEYLKDETGGRRFWPVRCGTIRIDDLRRDRDQLWAEARERFRAGDKWWLDSQELVRVAAEEQGERFDADPWEPIIAGYAEGREYVTSDQILESCIEKPKKDWTQKDKNRVAKCLKALKWDRFQQRIDYKKREWRYAPTPVSPEAGPKR
jgi:predicted P-loop ATPase